MNWFIVLQRTALGLSHRCLSIQAHDRHTGALTSLLLWLKVVW